MEVYEEIKKDILFIFVAFLIISLIFNALDVGIDETDKDGFNRSGFELLTDYGTGKQYLHKNGSIIERKK